MLWLAVLAVALRYAARPEPAQAKQIETAAALFVLAVYLVVGPIAMAPEERWTAL